MTNGTPHKANKIGACDVITLVSQKSANPPHRTENGTRYQAPRRLNALTSGPPSHRRRSPGCKALPSVSGRKCLTSVGSRLKICAYCVRHVAQPIVLAGPQHHERVVTGHGRGETLCQRMIEKPSV